MSHGASPILKRIKGGVAKAYHCESCDRQLKIKNKCEMHMTDREPCYYCHLILQHFDRGDKSKESSPKKPLEQKA